MAGPWVPWLNCFIRAPLHTHHSTLPTGLAFWGQKFQSRFHHHRKSDTGVGPTLPEKAVFPHVSQWHTEHKYEVLSTWAKQWLHLCKWKWSLRAAFSNPGLPILVCFRLLLTQKNGEIGAKLEVCSVQCSCTLKHSPDNYSFLVFSHSMNFFL